ncbi:MAG: hypothetical protein CMH90_03445 [Oceanicaulis sp.]|uniref:hypothetical protein n=1 Tax=Oceanicaulis sp. UBA2681 TaxID=1947007 RepID=UPI000C09F5DD|nr:hypothetical protein [Oceanicaulis sp. UBA2681]MAP48515.1 hypothetical protein [Oceanicaulis sp.]HCR67432.1 hypothetical protein [Oceanicaulis sp.]|tara:strand:+ start:169 stop:654 length:486 start_codon:yes stop_codon:yes gene_type:complete
MTLNFKAMCGAAISLTLTAAIVSGSALARQDESASPSPLNQIYRVEFGSAPPVYGGAIYFSFGDALIDSYTETGIGGADQPGGTGTWYADGGGRISILGDAADPGYEGEELPPRPALQLLADGQSEVSCESWPHIEVGASAQASDLCWITNSNVLSVTRTQ